MCLCEIKRILRIQLYFLLLEMYGLNTLILHYTEKCSPFHVKQIRGTPVCIKTRQKVLSYAPGGVICLMRLICKSQDRMSTTRDTELCAIHPNSTLPSIPNVYLHIQQCKPLSTLANTAQTYTLETDGYISYNRLVNNKFITEAS